VPAPKGWQKLAAKHWLELTGKKAGALECMWEGGNKNRELI
jgi:hypothetical protein